MRSSLELPLFSTAKLFENKKLCHRFFYKINSHGQEVDFSTPVNSELVSLILDEFSLKRVLFLNQTHSDHVLTYPSYKGYKGADSIITNAKNVGLIIRHADCQAALFYDPVKEVIAAVHAGYKGQAQFIYTHTIKKMTDQFGSLPKDIGVAISAGLGIKHSEFINYRNEFPIKLHKYNQDGFMDLKKMALDELIAAGLLKEHIDIDPRCSYEEEALFYSYRKDKTPKRMASFISLI
jgi:YfiH family protein